MPQIIRSAEERYGGDERVQLDLVADHFVSVFRDAELPFNKLLAEQPLPKVHLRIDQKDVHCSHATVSLVAALQSSLVLTSRQQSMITGTAFRLCFLQP